jgi:hypothetical protein
VPSKATPTPDFLIPAAGISSVLDDAITIDNPPAPGHIEGFMEYKLLYGRSGRLQHSLCGKKQVIIAFNEHGSPVKAYWHESV